MVDDGGRLIGLVTWRHRRGYLASAVSTFDGHARYKRSPALTKCCGAVFRFMTEKNLVTSN